LSQISLIVSNNKGTLTRKLKQEISNIFLTNSYYIYIFSYLLFGSFILVGHSPETVRPLSTKFINYFLLIYVIFHSIMHCSRSAV
jgi:hypothetical protein